VALRKIKTNTVRGTRSLHVTKAAAQRQNNRILLMAFHINLITSRQYIVCCYYKVSMYVCVLVAFQPIMASSEAHHIISLLIKQNVVQISQELIWDFDYSAFPVVNTSFVQ
jgi:hypothetical protein